MLVNFALHELKETNEIKVEEEGEKKNSLKSRQPRTLI